MQSYQFEQISADPDKPLADSTRPLDTADMERYKYNLKTILKCYALSTVITPSFCIDRLKDVQSLDELGDVYNHFLLYYGRGHS